MNNNVHLQTQRNISMFLGLIGVRSFVLNDYMSFKVHDYRLDLAICSGMLSMTLSTPARWFDDESFLKYMSKIGGFKCEYLFRVYLLPEELGINSIVSDDMKSEEWFRIYNLQKMLLNKASIKCQ